MSLKSSLSLADRRTQLQNRAELLRQELTFLAKLHAPKGSPAPEFRLRLYNDRSGYVMQTPENGWDRWHDMMPVQAHISLLVPPTSAQAMPLELPYLVIAERRSDYQNLQDDWVTVSVDTHGLADFVRTQGAASAQAMQRSFDSHVFSVAPASKPPRIEWKGNAIEEKVLAVIREIAQGIHWSAGKIESVNLKNYTQKTYRAKVEYLAIPSTYKTITGVASNLDARLNEMARVCAKSKVLAERIASIMPTLGQTEISLYGSDYDASRNAERCFSLFVKVRPTPVTCCLTVRLYPGAELGSFAQDEASAETKCGLVIHDLPGGLDSFKSLSFLSSLLLPTTE